MRFKKPTDKKSFLYSDLNDEAPVRNVRKEGENQELGGYTFDNPQYDCEYVPTSATQVLKEMGISDTCTIGGITSLPQNKHLSGYESKHRCCTRYAWFAPVDEKGSTPIIIKKLLYVLHHVFKFYNDVQKPGGKCAPFEPKNCVPRDAMVNYRNGMAYHYITCADEIVTVPVSNLSMYIDVASTGGYSAMKQAYQFVVLETPITFDLVENVTLSCRYSSAGADASKVCDVLKGYWCDIASHMAMMDGNTEGVNVQNFMRVQFDDLFNDVSIYCFWKLFRIARCVSGARRHMHLLATKFRTENCDESWKEASNQVQVRFDNIDQNCSPHYNPYLYDALWCKLSDKAAGTWYMNWENYRATVEKHKKKKRAKPKLDENSGDGEVADADYEEPCDPFEPNILIDVPTYINHGNDTVRNFLSDAIDDDNIDMLEFENFLHSQRVEDFSMNGFPRSMMEATIELNLFKPFTSKYTQWERWSTQNSCNLPAQMTLPLLLLKDQRNKNDEQAESNVYINLQNNFGRDCNTLADYRQYLRQGKDANMQTRPMKGRCDNVYRLQFEACMKMTDPTKRVKNMYESYCMSTVIPIVLANIKSDTGEMGGSDPRLAITSQISAMANFNSTEPYRCRAVHTFRLGLKSMMQHTPQAADLIKTYRGGMVSSENCLFLCHDIRNQNGNLKPDNQRLLFAMHDTDVGYYLDGLGSHFELAKNFIGLALWVMDMNGCAGTREKTRGTGVDEGKDQFITSYTPAYNDPPVGMSLAEWPEQGETKGVSPTALFDTFCVTVDKNGKVSDCCSVARGNLSFTEVRFNDKNENENWGRISECLDRNTSAASRGSRDVSIQDPETGNWVPARKQQVWQARVLVLAVNNNDLSHFAETVNTVTTQIASGGVEVPDKPIRKRKRNIDSREHMGMSERYYGRREIPWVRKVSSMLGRDLTSVANLAAFTHSCGFFGHCGVKKVKMGVETTWMDVIISLTRNHHLFMSARAACPQNWSRITDMARTRVVPYGMQLHAMNALLHPEAPKHSWNDVVYSSLVNFIAEPVPAQTIPVFLGSLLYQSFDWMLWIVMGMFVSFFEVPHLDPDVMEKMFADPTYKVDESHAKPIRRWLEKIGISSTGPRTGQFECMVAPFDSTPQEKSAVYVSTVYNEDANGTDGKLVQNIEPPRGNSFNDENKNASNTDRMCVAVAKILAKTFATQLKSACNIADNAAGRRAFKCIADCLIKYSAQALPYHRFGPVPSGRGFQSVNAICAALGLPNGYRGAGFVNMDEAQELYKTTPFLVRQQNGQLYQLGVDWRWLLMYKSVIGFRPSISQSSVQCLFHHWTEQFVMHRVPKTLFPNDRIFSSMPCAQGGGFAYTKLPPHDRPTTMMRPQPQCIVLDRQQSVCCGLLTGLHMPEDQYFIEAQRRLAESVCDEACTVTPNDVVLPVLKPPALPMSQYVYVEISISGDSQCHRGDRYPGVIITENGQTAQVFADKQSVVACDTVSRLDNQGQVTATSLRYQDTLSIKRELTTLADTEICKALSFTEGYFVHYQKCYCRTGVVVEIELTAGCTVYAVAVPWSREEVDADVRYYNPATMGYLLTADAVSEPRDMWPSNVPVEFSDTPGLFQSADIVWNVAASIMNEIVLPVGKRMLLDCDSPEAQQFLIDETAEIKLVDVEFTSHDWAARGMTLSQFKEKARGDTKLLPVIEVTLLYELPQDILALPKDDNSDAVVYVGFKTENEKNTYCNVPHVEYAAVSPRALVTESRARFLNYKPVHFAFF